MPEEFSDIPSRSSDGLAALDVFYNVFNEVNFYVEDTDQENLYEEIFRTIFPSVKFQKIFPLGGKAAVLAHATDPVNNTLLTKRIYILDKDFDDLLGTMLNMGNVFYLDRYCIENHLLDGTAIVNFLIEEYPKKKRSEINKKLNINHKINEVYESLRPLFILFYCVQFLRLDIKNCKSKPEKFCVTKKLWEVNQSAIEDYLNRVVTLACQNNVSPELTNPFDDERFSHLTSTNHHSLVSGKFILAMIFHYIKSHYSLGSTTLDSFTYRLAKNSNLESLNSLAVNVLKIIKNDNLEKDDSSASLNLIEAC